MKPENIYNIANFTVYQYLELKSTNQTAKNLLTAGQINSKHIILATSQTQGVGKNGRVWQSLPNNLCCSIIMQIATDFCQNYTQLSLLTAVALGKTLQQIKNDLTINYKWPNDILLDCQKVAGILIDSTQTRQGYQDFIIGIGLNLQNNPNIINLATTSLAKYGINCSNKQFLECFLPNFDCLLQNWQDYGFLAIKKSWLNLAYKFNQNITINTGQKTTSGVFVDINNEGNLVLQNDSEKLVIASCDW